ncbi:MAG: NUDIX hydrolase [Paracoccaceae bacterium]
MAEAPPIPGSAAVPIRDAATILLIRRDLDEPAVLMGQRGSGAIFMPNKYVFPGGAVDPDDATVPLAAPLSDACAHRLCQMAAPGRAAAIAAAAVRELWEETGLILGRKGVWQTEPPRDWRAFAAAGYLPSAASLRFVFRAITPSGRPRRFDARFFLADAAEIAGDLDDFSRASDELGHLHWVPLSAARQLNLPFITEVVLGEVAAEIGGQSIGDGVAFFDNSGPVPAFRRLA